MADQSLFLFYRRFAEIGGHLLRIGFLGAAVGNFYAVHIKFPALVPGRAGYIPRETAYLPRIIQKGERPVAGQRGFNNTGLYISATGSRIRVVGAWRGYPIAHTLAVDGNIGDTLVLKDTDNMSALYKFRIKNNTISGRHRVLFDDGTSHVIDAKATIRQLNQNEVDRLRSVINF